MKNLTTIVLTLLVVASPVYANEERGGCGNRRCESDQTVEEAKEKDDEYVPPNNSGPDSRHGSGTR